VLLIGVDPDRERQINPFLKKLPADDMIRSADSRDAVVGARLLNELQIRPGQKFVVTAQHEDGTLHSELLRVRGVVSSGMKNVDSSLILVGRERAALLTGNSGSVHELAVILADARQEKTVHRQIAAKLPDDQDILAVSWEKAMPNLANAIKLDYASQKFIFIIILLIVTIGVINTLLMSVMERMREFGVILAMGSKPMTLRGLIILEAVIMGLLAAAIGSILGSLATWYLVTVGIDLAELVPETLEFGGVVFDPVMRASWDPAWMIRIAVYVVCLTLAAAAYPAIKAGRTTPVEGMRHH
jgi:ABC-type lipoprotein release transport system permease subunit